MGITNGIITNMGTKLAVNGSGDLQTAFGSSQASQAWYFSSAPIKMGAMKKPFLNTTVIFADMNARDTARVNANYGLTIPACTAAQILAADWTLHRPNGTSYPRRALDFEGYYHGAPDAPLYCTKDSDTIVANTINADALNPCAFFVYQKSGQLADKQPDASGGTSTTSAGRNSTQIAACLQASELKTDGGTLLTSLTNPYLGIAIFNGSSLVGFAGCTSKLVASQSTRDNDMFIVRLASFTGIAAGTYTGKACIRYGSLSGYNYVPLPSISGVCRNTFTVKIGGADMYTYWKRGLSKTNTTSSTGSIRTTGSTVYATIRIQNNSGITHSTDPANYNKWILVVSVTGTVNGSSIAPPNRRLTMKSYPAGMAMANGQSIDVTFQIDRIWNNDPTKAAVVVTSGSINIEAYLYYNDGGADSAFTRGAAAQQAALSVTYGN